MPHVNWDIFAELPGSAEKNFEMLCRGLVWRHYARYGDFRALAAQPGVEFHLKLRVHCELGGVGRWYGWQCRWYDHPGGRALGASRRKKIAEAISRTEKILPELTDWVLWTRRPLTKGDQEWFFHLKTRMDLHLWTAAEIEDHLSGPAEILRRTYFGELVLRPEMLEMLHGISVAPILPRWNPAVHQTIQAEREISRMLAEPATWLDVRQSGLQLLEEAKGIEVVLKGLPEVLKKGALEVAASARTVGTALQDGYKALDQGDLELLRQQIMIRPGAPSPELAAVPRHLRSYGHQSALIVTNAFADIRRAHILLREIESYPSVRTVAVLADAGSGKTELAAQLTSTLNNRPAGILLLGRSLGADHGLDDLAHTIVIQGVQVPTMEALVAAVDAAGQRAHRRLPIIIDGLNEAEDCRNWKPILAALDKILTWYPYVLVVCTLRTPFAAECLPPDITRLTIPDFQQDSDEAIRKYFKYYRINASDAVFPWRLLHHPLTLRLFCEVTNPKREHIVGVEAMPLSLTALFDRYLEQASQRIVQLSPRDWRYYELDVRTALDKIGWALWETRSRSLDFVGLRQLLGDDTRQWHGSIVRAFEQEGVLLRVRERGSTTDQDAILYDALAGHLVADAIVSKYGRGGMEDWLEESATISALSGPLNEQHPLGHDILIALVGLLPRRFHRQQLWPLLDEPTRKAALLATADLEAAYLDLATVTQLGLVALQPPDALGDLFNRLWSKRSSSTHPLNSTFLDVTLRPMSVAQRDVRWTEWIRKHSDEVVNDLQRMERRWHTIEPRSQNDYLRAQWIMWTLTSTVRSVRDQATRSLYWFGRGDAASLFKLTLASLSINDVSVPERMLAASYGVVMAYQLPNHEFESVLGEFLLGLRGALTGPKATMPTSHWLARVYVQGCVTFALNYYRKAVPSGLANKGYVTFASGPEIDPIEIGAPHATELDATLNAHYTEDTLGDFVGFRRNYGSGTKDEHPAVAHLRGTLWSLGWRSSDIGAIDKTILRTDYRGREIGAQSYAYKYAWIGLYTFPKILDHYRRIWDNRRPPDVQIDPSFPQPSPQAAITIPPWARQTPVDDQRWMRQGVVTVPDDLFYVPSIGSHSGPWLVVDGYLYSRIKVPDRGVFGFVYALLVDTADADRLVDALNTKSYPGNHWLPVAPEDHYTFAGEIPWNPEFAGWIQNQGESMYLDKIEVDEGPAIEVESLAHRFAWESYHSTLNQAGGALVPSKLFSLRSDLRGIPQSFDQTLIDGTTASISLGAPAAFDGSLLYLREDLVARYAAGRTLVWFIWGERSLYSYSHDHPDWLVKAHQERAMIWRRVVRGEQLSTALRVKKPVRKRQSAKRSKKPK